ncbi:MAG: hypothetical protein ABSG92_04690 [Conexivisphaerales archaeon]
MIVLPFAGLYVAEEIDLVSLDADTLLVISTVLLLVDLILLFIGSTFRRDEILTKLKSNTDFHRTM